MDFTRSHNSALSAAREVERKLRREQMEADTELNRETRKIYLEASEPERYPFLLFLPLETF